jgi:hypothetical protein
MGRKEVDLAYYVAVWRLTKDYYSGQGSKGYRYACIADDKIRADLFSSYYDNLVFANSRNAAKYWYRISANKSTTQMVEGWYEIVKLRKRVAFWLKTLRKYRWSL